jgi:hypothetical protein
MSKSSSINSIRYGSLAAVHHVYDFNDVIVVMEVGQVHEASQSVVKAVVVAFV